MPGASRRRRPNRVYDVGRSLAVAEAIELEPRACYKNALLAFLTLDELRGGSYVEGFAVPDFGRIRLPLEHGWVELADGTVVDPSLAALGHADVAFFPAVRLSWQRARRLVAEEAELPYLRSHRTDRHRRAYLTAQVKAHEAAFGPDAVAVWR
jgi:hypothetical protein